MSKYIEVSAVKTPDGLIFEDEDEASNHYDNLLGEELDGLMRLSKISITRTDEYKLIVGWMAQPKELKKVINAIHALVNFDGEY